MSGVKSHRKPEKRSARKQAQPKKRSADPGEATLSDVARQIGLPDATLHDHVTKECLSATKRDGRLWLKWVDVATFYAHRKGYAPESQRERLAREQADKFALENDERRKDLCSADVWNAAVSEEIARAHRVLLALAKREAPIVARLRGTNAIHAHLTDAIHNALRTLARPGRQ